MSADTPPPTRPPSLSPRRRRLRATLYLLGAVALLAGIAGVVLYLKTRPAPYRPDEQMSELTSDLARGLPPEAPRPRFTDVTREAGLADFRTFVGLRTSQLPEDMGPGAAWGDYDNDGDDDLFLVSQGGPMNQPQTWPECELHENLGDGTFRKAAFPDTRILGLGVAWGDCDGDGFLDLLLTGYNALLLFRNEADGQGRRRFVRDERVPNLKGYWAGASWGDYDNDRDLDLYVCNYVQYVENEADIARGEVQHGVFVPFTLNPNSYPGGTNCLFRNDGDGTFTEVAADLGVTNPQGRSLGALWHDFDDDGWLDLYVANDVSDNVFFHNRGGRFQEISHAAWVADYRSAMGMAVGDHDRDGDDELFITHWVAQENAFYNNLLTEFRNQPSATSAPPATSVGSPNPTAGNAAEPPPVRFMDIADMKGLGQIGLPYVGWGTEFADFDGDGWLDLIVVNGNTLEFSGPIPRKLKPQERFLFWNQRGRHFHNLAPLCKPLAESHVSRGLALSDFDQDGDLDLLLVHHGEGVQLLRNDMQTGHWLKVRLHSRLEDGRPLGFGEGAKVIAHIGGVALRRTVTSVSYLSQSSRTLHFGLGDAARVDQLEVRWQGGSTNVFQNLEANASWEITEGEPTPRRVASGVVSVVRQPASSTSRSGTGTTTDRERLVEFWKHQRAGMDAMKREKNFTTAARHFGKALELDPKHEDTRYYLAICLATEGHLLAALGQLAELQRLNSHSHRAWQQEGVLRALYAKSDDDLAAAEKALRQARKVNPEETGALHVLGEVALLRGDPTTANQHFRDVCQTNPRSVGALFLRGYLAWKQGDPKQAARLLEDARAVLGKDWHQKGASAEGDVKEKQHVETTPLGNLGRPAQSRHGLRNARRPPAT